MNKTNNPSLKPFAQELRRNMTKEEKHLWYDFLKKLPIKFNRQKVIGNYIVDFYCAEAKVVIELDGAQHYELNAREKDTIRDEYLNSLGILVLRYANIDFHKNFEGICKDILVKISNRIEMDLSVL